jgi:hypothetical protein
MKYLVICLSLFPQLALAHVKWFSNYDFQQAPLQLSDLNHPTFWGLFLLSLVCLPLLVWSDIWAEKSKIYQHVTNYLDQYSEQGPVIMRVAMGAVLLMSWQGNTIIAPDLAISSPMWGWIQFGLALLLLFKETTVITGLGMVAIYFIGLYNHGLFHMLDYVVYPAVGVYLAVSYSKNIRLRNLDLPVLYSGLGFSLCWVAFEKLFYPFWGLSVLAKAPGLTMGLNHEFFLMSCAFIEFSLGFLLIICLLHRPLAIIVTLTFFTSTCFFGKTEIIGHTILHGALLVFIVKGPGHYYQAPIRWHKSPWMRSLFAVINFIILFAVMAFPYQMLANRASAESKAQQAKMAHPQLEVPAGVAAPEVQLHAIKDEHGGWNLHLMTKNFIFAPQNAGKEDVMGEGHAHLYVNGKKVARVYGNWIHINLEEGVNKVKASLNSNLHKDYAVNGKIIESEIELDESRASSSTEHHH